MRKTKMKIVKAGYEILDSLDGAEILRKIERCGRVCYKSEDKISAGSAEDFVRGIIRRGHESVLEHAGFTVKFIVDRGVSHELVRHRIASFSQESTRYCNYADGRHGGEIAVIEPFFLTPDQGLGTPGKGPAWRRSRLISGCWILAAPLRRPEACCQTA